MREAPNFLNLPGYEVVHVEENAEDYHVRVRIAAPVATCAQCGSHDVTHWGTRDQLIKDLPMHAKRVGLYVTVRRLRCNACERTTSQPLPFVATNRRMTVRLENWLRNQSLKRPFTALAEETGVDEKTVRALFSETIAALENQIRIETPRWLGIDEIKVGQPRCVLTNVEERTLVDMLPKRDRALVAARLMRMSDRGRIELVTMDMWTPYRDAVTGALPKAQIVVDKFHVLRMANAALETQRKAVRSTLSSKERRGLMHDRFLLLRRRGELEPQEKLLVSTWLGRFGALREAYELKEAFFEIYDARDRAAARRSFASWRSRVTPATEAAFVPLLTAWTNWEPMILAYFEHRITNAYTESVNNLIRAVNRRGRGYTFEVLRAKMLFGSGLQRPARPKFQRIDGYAMLLQTVTTRVSAFEEPRVLGADIPTLTRRLEAGEI